MVRNRTKEEGAGAQVEEARALPSRGPNFLTRGSFVASPTDLESQGKASFARERVGVNARGSILIFARFPKLRPILKSFTRSVFENCIVDLLANESSAKAN